MMGFSNKGRVARNRAQLGIIRLLSRESNIQEDPPGIIYKNK